MDHSAQGCGANTIQAPAKMHISNHGSTSQPVRSEIGEGCRYPAMSDHQAPLPHRHRFLAPDRVVMMAPWVRISPTSSADPIRGVAPSDHKGGGAAKSGEPGFLGQCGESRRGSKKRVSPDFGARLRLISMGQTTSIG